jgi:hypothetical protein
VLVDVLDPRVAKDLVDVERRVLGELGRLLRHGRYDDEAEQHEDADDHRKHRRHRATATQPTPHEELDDRVQATG